MSNLDKRDELAQAIAEITDQLKRPMSNLESALLAADRKDLRAELADLEAPTLASLGMAEWEVPGAGISGTKCLCTFDALCCPLHDPSGARD